MTITGNGKKFRMFNDVSLSSSRGPWLSSVVQQITSRVAEGLEAQVVVIFLFNEEGGFLLAQPPAQGLNESVLADVRLDSRGEGPLSDCFRNTRPVLVSRRAAGEMDPHIIPDVKLFDLICCPLLARGRNIGVILAANKLKRRGFRHNDLALLEFLAPQIAVLLENALLYQKSEEKVAQLTSLIRVVDAINTVSSLDQLYNLALDVIKGLFRLDKALINIVNNQTGMLEVVRSFGYSEEYVEKYLNHPFEKIKQCYVLNQEGTFLCLDVGREDRCPNMAVDEDTRSVLCVPIRSGKNVYGIIHMASSLLNAFDEDDAVLANAIGEQVGMAVESARLFDEISQLAITDPLTGLYNVRHLKRVLGEEVRRSLRYSRPLSFIMLDIDFFKAYNDQHGHPRGDELLRVLSGLLQQNTRDVDTVFRYGGEEFSVIIPEVGKQEAFSMAERIRRVIQDYAFNFEEDQPGGNLTVSIGVANLPKDAVSGDELVEKADRALYRAKQMGRNMACLYSIEEDRDASHVWGPSPVSFSGENEADHEERRQVSPGSAQAKGKGADASRPNDGSP
jgi:diguanylate cyclase (GGDEF)-like protein